jgi:peptidoglycan/LPS O-acetylase OafA/YrhL
LDGWRALAILAVLGCHGLALPGSIGVDIFFGISGFLITSRLLDEQSRNGRISIVRFYLRRAFRILPAYLAYLGAVAILCGLGWIAISRLEWVSCALFLRNYLPAIEGHGWYTGHFWSLALEEHFYLLLPGLLVLVRSRRRRATGLLILALAIGLWRVIEFRLSWLDGIWPNVNFYTRTDTRLDGLIWGSIWGLLYSCSARVREKMKRWLSTPVWMGVVIALVVCMIWTPPLTMLWTAMLIPVLLLGTLLRPAAAFSQLLESALAQWLGRVSYSLYVWQQLFLAPPAAQAVGSPLWTIQRGPWNFLALMVVACASYYLLERPLLRLGQRISAGR